MQNQPYPLEYQLSNDRFEQTEMPTSLPYVDPLAEQQINHAVVQGFGQFFFDARDPNIAKTNIPMKQESQMHIPIIIATVIMIGCIVAGVAILSKRLSPAAGIALLIIPYLFYVGVSIGCSEIHAYITNLKKFEDYKQTYDKMIQGQGYFNFWIQCFHYKTVQTKNGTRTQKVVTHTAQEEYFPLQSMDESGNVTNIKDLRKYIFIKYLKKFYFTDPSSETTFTNAYNSFVSRNKRDQHQSHSQNFQIEGYEEEVGFCMVGDSPHNSIVFYVLALLGLALPYSCILERSVSRYEINILKRLTCR